MRVVIAVGGNSLIQDKDHIGALDQYEQIEKTNKSFESLLHFDHELVITHGNGPQVGFLLNMSELAEKIVPIFPLDYCVANTQGSIGYQIQNSLNKFFIGQKLDRKAVTIITQVLVDQNDPAFANPSKPIGSFFTREEIEKHAIKFGWNYFEDSGRGYRRVVSSPKPLDIVEKSVIVALLKEKFVVVAVGGGGIPVIMDNNGLKGVEAVIDKDFASSLLAQEINADLFVISTAVDCVYIHYNQPNQTPLREVRIHELESFLQQGFFGKGSMEPKIQAVIEFTKKTGKRSIITSPEFIMDAINGKSGTSVIP